MALAASEFILNADGSIYHLKLKPEDIANTIITVGDPNRVEMVTKYFDEVELKVQKREFHTQTGYMNGKRITVISTGIGTDNIDIVINELDALVNIDFTTGKIREELTSLDIIRIGTSGSIQEDIPVDSFLISEMGIGLDSLLNFYDSDRVQDHEFSEAFINQVNWDTKKSVPYCVSCSESLLDLMHSSDTFKGVTATNVGFYGPQGRTLRIPLKDKELNNNITKFNFQGKRVTNMEMETSGIYGLSKLLGHRALSMNAIVANRVNKTFSKNSSAVVDELIRYTLKRLT